MRLEVSQLYVDPYTKEPLVTDAKGHLRKASAPQVVAYENCDGVYDFVRAQRHNLERDHYDKLYLHAARRSLCSEDFQRMWHKEPGFRELLKSVGDCSGRRILLLGNGISLKELYFCLLGAECVYTDLSVEALKDVKAIFEGANLGGNAPERSLLFCAVDACHLPFPDESFDVIYGCSCVHHIEDTGTLFAEVSRCLKPGGICRFLDHAYSPLWQRLKTTALKPLQSYVHKKHGISPADLAATRKGGFRYQELADLKERFGFSEMLYLRVAFFEQLLQRGTLKLGGRPLRALRPLMRVLDNCLDKMANLVEKHGIVLVWGFRK